MVRGMRIERGRLGEVPFAARGSGPPLVILPGLTMVAGPGADRTVGHVLSPFGGLQESRRLVVINRWPGLPEAITLSELAQAYAAALRGLGSPVDVCGISTGGSLAQVLAAEHPEAVRRLALVSTGCRLSPELRSLQGRVARLLGRSSHRSAVALMARSAAPPALSWPASLAGWLAARRVLPGEEAARDLRVTLEAEDPFDLAHCAGTIEAPTLVVAGGRDRFYPRDLVDQTAALIPRSQVLIRPRRGHVSVLADPRARAHIVGFFSAS